MTRLTISGSLLLLLGPAVVGAEPNVQTVVEGLDVPSSVAIRPETDEVFVAECAAGRIVRIAADKPSEVIGGLGQGSYGEGAGREVRPLMLCFLDKNTLVVGGGAAGGQPWLRVFDLTKLGDVPLKAGEAKVVTQLPTADAKAPGPCRVLTAVKDAVILACSNDGLRGVIVRSVRESGGLRAYERFLPLADAEQMDVPAALAASPQGFLVVVQRGQGTPPQDSVLSFYNPKTQRLLLTLRISLRNVTGLAYSEKTGQLYVTELDWSAPATGGLFQLIAGAPGGESRLQVKKVAPLVSPTAVAFGRDGALYVTSLGAGAKAGRLLKFPPGL
jgi:hypothetical protein